MIRRKRLIIWKVRSEIIFISQRKTIVNTSPIWDGWSIPEVSYVFRSWLDNNERDYIREMENPEIKMSLRDKDFELQVTDTHTFKLRLNEVQKKLNEDDDIDSGVVVSFQKKESEWHRNIKSTPSLTTSEWWPRWIGL